MLILFFIPFALCIIALIVPQQYVKKASFALSLIPLAALLFWNNQWIGTAVQYSWFPVLSIQFSLGIDSLALLFLYLTAVIIPIVIISTPKDISYPQAFYSLVFLLEGLLFGFFTSRDLAFFAFFWEAMLLPLYFIITLWGGPKRESAAFKFLIYMIAGSSLMVAAVLAVYLTAGTFNINELAGSATKSAYTPWFFLIFFLAFAVKTPLFPFHAWLPDTYYQASTSGTILLSALLSKAGIFGFLRIGNGIFLNEMIHWSPWMTALAITGVFYGGFAAWMQNDYKRLIAYSSFSHVNFILAGVFVWNAAAQSGAILQAINHGITITALFLVAGWLDRRIGTTLIGQYKGVAKTLPKLCWLTLFFVLSSVALPGTNSFIGELLILFGLFKINALWAVVLTTTVVLSVMYMLKWMQKVYFEEPIPFNNSVGDIRLKEFLIASPLVFLILWIGIYPEPLLTLTQGSFW